MKLHPDYNNLLQFSSLNAQANIEHFCTTRKGGVSKGEFSSFNFGNFSDDSPTNIHENRQTLARMWYMDIADFIIPHQTHGNKVLVIDEKFKQLNVSTKNEVLYGVDATITQQKNIFLCVTTADCVPILLYDENKEIIAGIHAGWKGIVGDIIKNTILKMENVFQSNRSDIVVAIGPSISIKNYEIGKDVENQFSEAGFNLTASSFKNHETGKLHIDLERIVHDELVKLGIQSTGIETTNLCTYDNPELFFSARRQSIHCGRMLSGIKLVY